MCLDQIVGDLIGICVLLNHFSVIRDHFQLSSNGRGGCLGDHIALNQYLFSNVGFHVNHLYVLSCVFDESHIGRHSAGLVLDLRDKGGAECGLLCNYLNYSCFLESAPIDFSACFNDSLDGFAFFRLNWSDTYACFSVVSKISLFVSLNEMRG